MCLLLQHFIALCEQDLEAALLCDAVSVHKNCWGRVHRVLRAHTDGLTPAAWLEAHEGT